MKLTYRKLFSQMVVFLLKDEIFLFNRLVFLTHYSQLLEQLLVFILQLLQRDAFLPSVLPAHTLNQPLVVLNFISECTILLLYLLDCKVRVEEIDRTLLEAFRQIVISQLLLTYLSSHLLYLLLQQNVMLLKVFYLIMIFISEKCILLLQKSNLLIESSFLTSKLLLLTLQLFFHMHHLQFLNAIDLFLLAVKLLLKL